MKKQLLNFWLAVTVSLLSGNLVNAQSMSCDTIYLELNDSYGDGWSGNEIDVSFTGGDSTFTLASGFQSTIALTVPLGQTANFIWQGGGSWPSECSYRILDASNTVLYASPSGSSMTAGATQHFVFCTNSLCDLPTDLALTQVGITTADLIWSGSVSPGEYFLLEYGIAGFALGTGDTAWIFNDTTASLSGLMANSDYDFYVRKICSASDSSLNVGPVSATTLCNAISAFPYYEGFENAGSIPNCWSVANTNGASWAFVGTNQNSSVSAKTGSYLARFYSSSKGSSEYLVSPLMDLTSLSTPQLRFSYTMVVWGADQDEMVVYYRTSPTSPWTQLATYDQNITSWEDISLLLPNPSGTYQVAFEGISDYGYGVTLDDIYVQEAPACLAPANLALTTIGSATAELIWSGSISQGEYFLVEYDTSGFALGTGDTAWIFNDTTASLSGLMANSDYDFYVRKICSVSDSSLNVGPVSATTLCNAISAFPYYEDFENAGGLPSCYNGIKTSTSGFGWTIDQGGTASSSTGPASGNSGDYYVYLETSGGSLGDSAFIELPGMDLTSLSNPIIEYSYHMYGATMGSLSVEASIDGVTWSVLDTRVGQKQTSDADAYETRVVNLSNYISSSTFIRFKGLCGSSYTGDMAIDDIYVQEAPACLAPADLTVLGVNKTNVSIAWSGTNTSGYYLVEYDTAGFTPGTGDTSWVFNDTNFTPQGLNSGTDYDFYITSICGSVDSSTVKGPLSATTLDACIAPSNLSGYLNYYDAVLFWEGDVDASSYVVEFGTSGFSLGQGAMVIVPDTTAKITGLMDDTEYSFYVYTLCSAGDTSLVSGPIIGTTPKAPVEACGDITLILQDSYGDGWQGGTLNVYSTTDTTTYTLASGSSQSFTITNAYQDSLAFAWMDGESWDSEISYVVEDAFGTTIYSSPTGTNMTGGEIQFIAYCNTVPPQCAIPTGLAAIADEFDIIVTWDLDSSVQSYTLEYDTAGFTPGTGMTVNVVGDSTMITGLAAAATYDFYLVANCSATDSSDPTPTAVSATTAACAASNACEYEFVLVDTYGDGWDGWEITVSDRSGNVYATLGAGFTNGSSETHLVSICDGADVIVSVSQTALFASEVALLVNKGGSPVAVYNATSSTSMGTVMATFTTNCFAFCGVPTNIVALDVKSDSALVEVEFTGTVATVEYGPAGFAAGNGTVATITAPDSTFWMTGLNASTSYDVWASQTCVNGIDSDTLGPLTLTTSKCSASNQCDFTFELLDSYGDGWDGWEITVSSSTDGFVYAVLGADFTSGSSETHSVSICSGDDIVVNVSSTALYGSEIGLNVYRNSILMGDYATGQSPALNTTMTTFIANCNPGPACTEPTNLTANMFQTVGTFSWSGDSTNLYYVVEYGPTGFSPGSGTSMQVMGTTASINGMSPNTIYDFYVTAACDTATLSAMAGPATATTLSMPLDVTILDEGCLECLSANVGDFFVLNGDSIEVVDRSRLLDIVAAQGDLTKVCVSHVSDMKNVFKGASWFDQDISTWDVSNVTNMAGMFFNANSFNQDISTWDVSSVTNMKLMFRGAADFNQSLNAWNVGSVTNMSRMFLFAAAFDGAIGNWDVGNVNRMTEMFKDASAFDQDLSSWCVANFLYSPPANFGTNAPLQAAHYPNWGNCPQTYDDVTALATGAFVNTNGCIDCSALNIGDYFELGGDTLLVVDRAMLDSLVLLHADLSKVCVSNITDMKDALRGLRWFNTDISAWDVSNVTDMTNMFFFARIFNQDIGNWDVSNVERMPGMFQAARAFNQDIGGWDVSSVQRFRSMFRNADAFNQDIGSWDVSNVLNDAQMVSMFRSADNFSQDLSSWCVSNVASKPSGFDANSSLTASQLPAWGTCPTPSAMIANSNDPVDQNNEALKGADDALKKDEKQTSIQKAALFPNPTTGIVQISPVLEGNYQIVNDMGRTISKGAIKEYYDLSDQPAGIYILMLQTGNNTQFIKVIKL